MEKGNDPAIKNVTGFKQSHEYDKFSKLESKRHTDIQLSYRTWVIRKAVFVAVLNNIIRLQYKILISIYELKKKTKDIKEKEESRIQPVTPSKEPVAWC